MPAKACLSLRNNKPVKTIMGRPLWRPIFFNHPMDSPHHRSLIRLYGSLLGLPVALFLCSCSDQHQSGDEAADKAHNVSDLIHESGFEFNEETGREANKGQAVDILSMGRASGSLVSQPGSSSLAGQLEDTVKVESGTHGVQSPGPPSVLPGGGTSVLGQPSVFPDETPIGGVESQIEYDLPRGVSLPAALGDSGDLLGDRQRELADEIAAGFDRRLQGEDDGSESVDSGSEISIEDWNAAKRDADMRYLILFGSGPYNEMLMRNRRQEMQSGQQLSP